MARRLIVAKIGGSLLNWPSLRIALGRWAEQYAGDDVLVIVGGGDAVESMRELDRVWQLNAEAMHWRCVRMLDATWEIATELFPNWSSIPSDVELEKFLQSRRSTSQDRSFSGAKNHVGVVRVGAFYAPNNTAMTSLGTQRPDDLPVGWETTTDSIAAYLATWGNADELVLLKSCDCSAAKTIQDAVRLGLVDVAFGKASISVPTCKLVNLRDEHLGETTLSHSI